jgi:hypothetical protein
LIQIKIVNAAQEHYQAADKGVICIRFVLMVSKGGCSVPYPSAQLPLIPNPKIKTSKNVPDGLSHLYRDGENFKKR